MADLIFGTLRVIKEVGPNYICKCSRCGQTDTYNKYDLRNDKIKNCRTCKKFAGIEMGVQNEANLKVLGYRNSITKEGDIDVLCYCLKCGHKAYYEKEAFKANKMCDFCKKKATQSEIQKIEYTKKLKEQKIQLIERGEDKQNQRILPEMTKSEIVPKSYKEHLDKIQQLEEKVLNDKGMLNKDYVGKVFNGLEIISQEKVGSKYYCIARCVNCGESYKALLHKVISYRVTCMNCSDSRYTFMCPKCNSFSSRNTGRIGGGALSSNRNSFTITRGELFQGGILECPVCNNNVSVASLAYTSDQTDMRNQVLNSIDTQKFGDFERIDSATELVISSKVAYKGRDGKERFNCYCLEHKKHLCLTVEETIGYAHEACNERHMGLVPLVKK